MDREQHVFTKGKFTSTRPVDMVQNWAIYNNNRKLFDCVYFDSTEAFDRASHPKLITNNGVMLVTRIFSHLAIESHNLETIAREMYIPRENNAKD